MRINVSALLVLIAFCGGLLFVLRSRPGATPIAEAVVTVIILLSLAGFGLRGRNKS